MIATRTITPAIARRINDYCGQVEWDYVDEAGNRCDITMAVVALDAIESGKIKGVCLNDVEAAGLVQKDNGMAWLNLDKLNNIKIGKGITTLIKK